MHETCLIIIHGLSDECSTTELTLLLKNGNWNHLLSLLQDAIIRRSPWGNVGFDYTTKMRLPHTGYAGLRISVNLFISLFSGHIAIVNGGPASALKSIGAKLLSLQFSKYWS